MSIFGTGRSLTIDTSLLLDADTATSPAIRAGLEACLIGSRIRCLGVGTEG